MSDAFTFELHHYRMKKQTGFEGIIGPFGKVVTIRPGSRMPGRKSLPAAELCLQGAHMPEVRYRSESFHPLSLENSSLFIDGTRAALDFNRRAFRNKSRALTVTFRERSYTYTVLRTGRTFVLERPGVNVTLERAETTNRRSVKYVGAASDGADAVDLALAIVLKEVDTSPLTSIGAASAAVNAVLSPRRPEGGDYSDY
ncbi:hypothetical protein DWB77_07480 [Streptomyces hundungensis]|uniref:Uncharacterized protein n=1 Tax=Streptomyces hundungensis TaxID=1077946 RepID=A0A387H3J9_9ACTN|nr:hypothetical protein [Streptomyces hundungensis]AYG78256.1 hypothetical protein DWB77_00363 [Streptomyces hundungensis]AYG85263.1 hypothetical protein DWB77_07480 [Streptomyces hundungensis]